MKKRIFECDTCGRRSEERNDGSNVFPYDQGWKYIYNLQIKPSPILATEKIVKQVAGNNFGDLDAVRDKHFCSKDCLIKFIGQLLDEN